MRDKFALVGIGFFAIGVLLAVMITVFGPMAEVRVIGAFSLAFAALGLMVNVYTLHALNPEQFRAWKSHSRALLAGAIERVMPTLTKLEGTIPSIGSARPA
jgi:hypothetical protein